VLRVDDGRVTYVGYPMQPGIGVTWHISDLETIDPDTRAVSQVHLVEGWLNETEPDGRVITIDCMPAGTLVPGLPNRHCQPADYIAPEPIDVAFGRPTASVRVQRDAAAQYGMGDDATFGIFAIAARLNAGCADRAPCFEWEVVGRIDEPDGDPEPSTIPTPSPSRSVSPFPSPPTTEEHEADARQVLDDWETFVEGAPSDTVLVTESLTTQDHGWSGRNGDNAKSALGAGVIESEVDLPTDQPAPEEISWPDRSTSTVELLPAADALDAIRSEGGGDCGGCTPVHVVNVRLTEHEYDTTRGPTSLPTWEFTLREGNVHVYRVAAAHAFLLDEGQRASQIASVSIAPDGTELTVKYVGGACTDADRLRAHALESDLAVVAFVSFEPASDSAAAPTPGPCILLGVIYTRTVELNEPLGARTVLDLNGTPISRDATWLEPR
jgi:hypothetical protein